MKTENNSIWLALLGAFVIAWEGFNYATTRYPLVSIFGLVEVQWVSEILSLAMVGTDILFFTRTIMIIQHTKNNPQHVFNELKGIGLALLAVTFGDAFLTWWFLAATMEQQLTQENVLIPEIMRQHLDIIPVVVAILSWALQAAMISLIVVILYGILSDTSKKPNTKKFMPEPKNIPTKKLGPAPKTPLNKESVRGLVKSFCSNYKTKNGKDPSQEEITAYLRTKLLSN